MNPIRWFLSLGLILLLPACQSGKKAVPPFEVKPRQAVALEEGVTLYLVYEGKGEKPSLEDEVRVHYRGMLENGNVFDSSYDRGEPNLFPLGRLIKGWQIGLVEVPVGSKVRLVIPPAAGYGDRDLPEIPAGSTLIFDMELLGIGDEESQE